jgi:serine protease
MRISDDQQRARHHDVVDRDGDERDDGLSGFVILRLSGELDPGEGPDLRDHVDAVGLQRLVNYLDELGQPPTRRVITSVEPHELLRWEEEAMDSRLPPLNSLTRYWRVDAQGLQQPLEEIVEGFSRFDGVELAYAEMVVCDPAVSAVSKPLDGDQRYLDEAPTGIGARWAWTQLGGRGEAVGVVDVERGWRLGHEDLRGAAPTLIDIPPVGSPGVPLINQDGLGGFVGHHGTAVMGVIAADDNGFGVIGIAPSLDSLRAASIFDGQKAVHVADAVIGASHSMKAGDVLLLEVERGCQPHWLPTETDTADFDAIRLATSKGVTVIEAAGNGNCDLNTWEDPKEGRRLFRGHPDFRDSGAIMVGACKSGLVNGNSHARAPMSNHGARVDCYAWGESVTTTGYIGASPDTAYTHSFTGTSSAAAIIAGAAVLTQSMYLAKPGRQPLSPDQMRRFLSNPVNGTPQSPPPPPPLPSERIGSMPSLRLVKTQALDRLP